MSTFFNDDENQPVPGAVPDEDDGDGFSVPGKSPKEAPDPAEEPTTMPGL